MVSLVLLSRSYRALTLDQIRAALDRAFPGVFLPPNEQSFVVEGEEPGEPRLIKSLAPDAKGIFLLHHQPGLPLSEADDDDNDDFDPELRELFASDHSWISIDILKTITSEAEAYRFMCKAIAQLAPADAAGLMKPGNDALPFDDRVRGLLEIGRDPFEPGTQ